MVILLLGVILLILMMRSGYRAGLVTTMVRVFLWLVIFYISMKLAKPLGEIISTWVSGQFIRPEVPQSISHQGQQFLASGLISLLLIVIGNALSRYLLQSVHLVRHLPFLGGLDAVLGSFFYGVIALILFFFILQVLSVLPNAWIQDQLVDSPILNYYLDRFPVFSNTIYQWWL
ncbi:CvpA family protein [Convivina praedatoris]|uniref:CvpA family protein n=1 Tax=Convivina praedatoris TaxID=2880963 RepID=A0ABN8H8G9_9LACO|nr:CvpA family protein [Convivina sp. LMG 32447]CAH1852714.1 hypothetical protein LMG032447_00644 [Convivina sp. LMG 32447]CAH1852752.1 hypothetical protein R078138_00654 [Convivina sp. LMG 32447]CAH1854814.1 hypothetical protein R077815_01087 [Convivina sp. LMG 32447]